MKTVLLTGFEPFGGGRVNPSAEAAQRIAAEGVEGLRISALVLPVDAERALVLLAEALERLRPDACLMLGLADGVAALQVERVALNLCDFRIPDNIGRQLVDEPVVPGGPAAYFATAPVRALQEAALGAGVPAELSLSAGAYLCNMALYAALHLCETRGLRTRCGFVHVPALPEQALAERRARPSMSLDLICAGVRAMLRVLAVQA
ncbi:MAG TPA: pyroglutamyl-peptidase I [Roseiflexaceae bacterium]|nr:pyroglutamyl-peptidase I [Roseiflexaceae bacterium]